MRTLKLNGCDWILETPDTGNEEAENFLLKREGGQHFHVAMVTDTVDGRDGSITRFRQPMVFEHDLGRDKVGDVVIQYRKHPRTGRWCVQVEEENIFETEEIVKKAPRAARSSVDNIAQAVKRTVAATGMMYANPRRIGGKPIKAHYVIAGWSPQLAESVMDVYDFVQLLDGLGLAAFLKALQHMPAEPAGEIFKHMRIPPVGEAGGK